MKLLFVSLIALSILGYAESDQCLCYANQTVSSTIAAVTIGSPTPTGAFGPQPCAPVQCTTIVQFTGTLNNSLPAGAQISIVQCANLTSANTVTLVEKNQTFSSCPAGVYKFNIDYSSIFTFKYDLTFPITFTVVLQPMLRSPPTTVAPPVSTTSAYQGPFSPNNPAISRIDLTIGLDTNSANEKFFNNSREVITNIVKYFTYSSDFVRLSFMTFDPFAAAGTGKYPLWSHNVATMTENLNNMPFYPGNQSKYFSALDTFFFTKLTDFPLRDNTERVFIIFTGTDAAYESAYKTSVPAKIDANDIKFIYVNMNTGITTTTGPGTYYQNLATLTGTDSNAAHWYDYELNQNNAENILKNYYFNGNTLCNEPDNQVVPVTNASPATFDIPTNPAPTKNYCNYMNDVRTYANPNPAGVLQVYFFSYDLSNEKDVIRIGINGTEVSELTGQYGSAFYCIPGTPITVTFQSKDGLVYNGYKSTVRAFPDAPTCRSSPPTPKAIFIDHTKRH